jgi:putative flippase GtrA
MKAKSDTGYRKPGKVNIVRFYDSGIGIPVIDATFIRFVFVGIVNTIIGYSLIMLFFHLFGLSYGSSYFLSYVIAFVISFFLNRRFVFFSRNKKLREFIRFVLSFLTAYMVSYVFLYLFVEYKIMDEHIAFFAGMVIYSTLFFLLNKHVTFKQEANTKTMEIPEEEPPCHEEDPHNEA